MNKTNINLNEEGKTILELLNISIDEKTFGEQFNKKSQAQFDSWLEKFNREKAINKKTIISDLVEKFTQEEIVILTTDLISTRMLQDSRNPMEEFLKQLQQKVISETNNSI